MARNSSQRGRKNNNPEGHNQYDRGWMDSAKDRPMTTAAAAAAAVGAGVFLWSRRNQISDQISNLSNQVADWAGSLQSDSADRELEMADSGNETGSAPARKTGRKQGLASGSNSGSAFETTGI